MSFPLWDAPDQSPTEQQSGVFPLAEAPSHGFCYDGLVLKYMEEFDRTGDASDQ